MKVDRLRQAKHWYGAIAHSITSQNPQLTPLQISQAAQNVLIAVFCLPLYQQRGLIAADPLPHQDNLYRRMRSLLKSVNQQYGTLFPITQLSPQLILEDTVLATVLQQVSEIDSVETLGQVYEQCLHWGEAVNKKTGGIFYTPTVLVRQVVQQTVEHWFSTHQTLPSVMDPSCGSGAFLLAAYQQLLDSHASHPLTQDQRQQILLQCIYGIDLDPQAIALTRLSLLLKLLENLPHPVRSPLPDLSQNIHCGNTLLSSSLPSAPGFNLVIGNPPYLDSEQMLTHLPHWRTHCNQHYRTAKGNWDLFCVFIEKGLELCQEGGLNSFVVPNKLTSANYAAAVRSLLTQENTLLALRDYSEVRVFSAAVYPVVYVAQKTPASATAVAYERMRSLEQVAQRTLLHPVDFATSDHPWLLARRQHTDLVTRLQISGQPLETLATVTGAATVAEAYALRSLIQEGRAADPPSLKLINSGTIDRYRALWGEKRLRYLGTSYLYPVIPGDRLDQLPPRRLQQAQQPKILVAGLTKGLECVLDTAGSILAGKSTSVIQSGIDLRYLLGLLNSRLMRFYITHRFTGNTLQGGYLRIGPPQIRQLPLPPVTDGSVVQQLIARVEHMLHLCNPLTESSTLQQIAAVDETINGLVYQLYGLSDAEIELVNYAD